MTITGLGCEQFDEAVKAIIELHSVFASHLPADVLLPWSPIIDDNNLCLEFNNRYFTPEHLAKEYNASTITNTIDPMGLLNAIAESCQHTEDNDVLYFEKAIDGEK